MNDCLVPIGISAAACAMAEGLTIDEINALGALFTVLGDQLCLIAAQKQLCDGGGGTIPE